MEHLTEDDTLIVFSPGCDRTILEIMNNVHSPRAFGMISNRVLFLMHIYVPPDTRGRGIGSRLLHHFLREGYNLGCRRAELDDMSAMFSLPTNLYVRHGFRYVRDGQPEMRMSLGRRHGYPSSRVS